MFPPADTVKSVSYYFTVPTEVRKTSIKTMLNKSYEHDFVEPESQYCVNNKIIYYDNLSKNGSKLLELMGRESAKIERHCQFLLPLKDKELVLPNKRMAAMKCM